MAKRKKKSPRETLPPTATSTSAAIPWREIGALTLLALVTLWAYWPAMHGEPVWDDAGHITRAELRSGEGLVRIWFKLGATQQYYPLLHSVFWLEHKLWGDDTFGYHLVNVLLHLAAVVLVYVILRRLKIPGALLAAALFALHPVHVESVAWITEQKNTLSAVFYLGALLIYLRFDDSRQRSQYAVAMALFVLGLLSKTVTATLPAALLVIFWWRRGTISWRRDVLPLVPFFVLAAIAGLFTAWVERTIIGAEGEDFDLSLVQRSLLAGRVIWFYLGKIFWPTNLTFIYPRWEIDPAVWWQWLFPLAALAAIAVLWAIRSRWRAPLAGALLFVGTLFPVLGFLNVFPFIYSFVADHFQYLASLGVIVLAAAGAAIAIPRLQLPMQALAKIGCLIVLGILAMLTWRQSHMYRDIMALYETTIERNPRCWMAYNNLGIIWAERGETQKAIERYEQAIRIKPDYAEAHSNLGAQFEVAGRYEEALTHFDKALQLRPKYDGAHNNLGVVLMDLGRTQEAITHFEQALSLNARYADARLNLGDALLQTGRTVEASESYRQAIRLRPEDARIRVNLVLAYAAMNRTADAMAVAQQALELARAAGDTELVGEIESWLKEQPAPLP